MERTFFLPPHAKVVNTDLIIFTKFRRKVDFLKNFLSLTVSLGCFPLMANKLPILREAGRLEPGKGIGAEWQQISGFLTWKITNLKISATAWRMTNSPCGPAIIFIFFLTVGKIKRTIYGAIISGIKKFVNLPTSATMISVFPASDPKKLFLRLGERFTC